MVAVYLTEIKRATRGESPAPRSARLCVSHQKRLVLIDGDGETNLAFIVRSEGPETESLFFQDGPSFRCPWAFEAPEPLRSVYLG